jgi:hypothetical protein
MPPEEFDSLLARATPFPWGRDEWGNLVGANGEAIFFAGVDSVLVEYGPILLQCLMDIRREASLNRKDQLRQIKSILRLANATITNVAEHPFCNRGASQSKPLPAPPPHRNAKR